MGITPFLAVLNDMTEARGAIHLFYCVRNAASAAHLAEVEEYVGRHDAITLHVVELGRSGRLGAQKITDRAGLSAADMDVFFCGPDAMRRALSHDLAARGLPARRFHFEAFEIRSGLGLRRLAAWLAGKGVPKLLALATQVASARSR
ncbi:MAG: hypothetical protein AAF638_06945 [Pseudomonadota bacterium]